MRVVWYLVAAGATLAMLYWGWASLGYRVDAMGILWLAGGSAFVLFYVLRYLRHR